MKRICMMCCGVALSLMALVGSAGWGYAQEVDPAHEQAIELAKKLANPLANLISVPIQYNYDSDFGPTNEGTRGYLNIQPILPFHLSEKWNLITRTIVPVVWQSDLPLPGISESGLGDITASQWFSPEVQPGDLIWGIGPVWLLPTASDETLGTEKWGIGPTAIMMKQGKHLTAGVLINHIFSFAGDDDRSDISATFLQPVLAYLITKTRTTLVLNTESTYDWENEEWSVPINGVVAQMLKIGKLPFQVSVGARYWADAPEYGPEGWGFRTQLTFIFLK